MLFRVCVFSVVTAGLYALPEGDEIRFGKASLARLDHCLAAAFFASNNVTVTTAGRIGGEGTIRISKGFSRGTGDYNNGVRLALGGFILAIGTANIIVSGMGGGGSSSKGVFIDTETGAEIRSSAGLVSINSVPP